ncbi:MAG TPA: MFS transporter, partial [Solirubrobacteraceae bacterium]|nr:MFS transporter [Solirubrobacteraceae bacterium]
MTDAVAPSGLRAYAHVLSVPGAAAFCSAGALARLSQGMIGLGSVLMVSGLGRSYTLAGLVAGAIALSQSLIGPQTSRLADRLGQTRVLLPQLAVHVLALGALVASAGGNGAGPLLVAIAVAAGASQPQVGAFARARWTALLPDEDRLRTALAVESLIEEAVFIVGPVVVTVLATAIAPAAGLLTAIGVVVAGCLLFVAQRTTEPRPHAADGGHVPHASALRSRGLVVVVAVFLGMGAVFGLVEVSIVAFAREHGDPGATGPMLGLWATGSLLSGIAYGAIAWRAPAHRRFLVAVGAFALGTILIAGATESLAVMTVALFVAGLANAPTLITGNTLVPAVVPRHAVTEAYTWLSVTLFAGMAVGSAAAGALIDGSGASA